MISLVTYNSAHFDALTGYSLNAEQRQYVIEPYQWFSGATLLTTKEQIGVTILYQNLAVGFFILDYSENKQEYSANPHAVLLRSFSINPSYQGRGIAKRVIAADCLNLFVRSVLPKCNEIVLAVNPSNQIAHHLYLATDFHATGKMVLTSRGTLCAVYQRQL